MTYALLCIPFLALAALIAALAARRVRSGDHSLLALVLAALILFVLTAVFDSIMIAAGLFTYGEGHIVGITLGLAPIEDLAYPLAAVILLPALWARLRSRHDR